MKPFSNIGFKVWTDVIYTILLSFPYYYTNLLWAMALLCSKTNLKKMAPVFSDWARRGNRILPFSRWVSREAGAQTSNILQWAGPSKGRTGWIVWSISTSTFWCWTGWGNFWRLRVWQFSLHGWHWVFQQVQDYNSTAQFCYYGQILVFPPEGSHRNENSRAEQKEEAVQQCKPC